MSPISFEELLAENKNFLTPFAVSLTHDQETAHDLTQETLLRALLNQEKYKEGTNIKGWLFTIMRNIFINQYRRNKKFHSVELSAPTEAIFAQQGNVAANDGWANLRMGEIKKSIDNLPKMFRLCFELHYSGYKYQEIAEMLQEPLGTVKSRIHFARKIMVSQLER